jgi:hypothetical protein
MIMIMFSSSQMIRTNFNIYLFIPPDEEVVDFIKLGDNTKNVDTNVISQSEDSIDVIAQPYDTSNVNINVII